MDDEHISRIKKAFSSSLGANCTEKNNINNNTLTATPDDLYCPSVVW